MNRWFYIRQEISCLFYLYRYQHTMQCSVNITVLKMKTTKLLIKYYCQWRVILVFCLYTTVEWWTLASLCRLRTGMPQRQPISHLKKHVFSSGSRWKTLLGWLTSWISTHKEYFHSLLWSHQHLLSPRLKT